MTDPDPAAIRAAQPARVEQLEAALKRIERSATMMVLDLAYLPRKSTAMLLLAADLAEIRTLLAASDGRARDGE